MVLHGERAYLEAGAYLELRLAEIDPLQDVELAHGEDAAAGGLVAGGLGALGELRANPRRVQRGREQLHEVRLALARAAGTAGEGKEADGAALGVMDAVHQELRRAEALELAGEAATTQRRISRPNVQDDRLVAPLFPGLEERRRHRGVAQEHVAEEIRLRRGHREAIGTE